MYQLSYLAAHYEKMKVYKEVPMWWYIAMFVSSMAMALATNYTGEAQLPWYVISYTLPRVAR